MFDEITAETSFTRIEEQVRRLWRLHDVAAASGAAPSDAPPYRVDQQPLAVAGQPWPDQARLLATADLLARYLAMRGFAVQRDLGWECHGLRVETAVEQALGQQASEYDLAQFNASCRDAALAGMEHGQALAERLGIWLDPSDTFASLSPSSIGAVWTALHQLWQDRRFRRERRIVSTCPRCATPLSAAEAARRAVEVEARAVWVRLPWDGDADTYFLVWTPAAWTLAGMVALAAHPDASYALVEMTGRRGRALVRLLLAESAVARILSDDYQLVRRLSARSLRRVRYRPLFTFLPADEGAGRIILSDEVPLDRGTGLLPVTPAFDARSLALAQAHDLPVPRLLDDWGGLNDKVTPWRGLSPFDAEPMLVEALQVRGLLFREEAEPRPRPLCPYCETPLLPEIRDVWLLETGSGPWVIGRDRAWGTPLPVWECGGCGQQTCLAGLDDLAHRAGVEAGQIDLHRPAIDRIGLSCPNCGETMHRVAAVVDAAFEAAVLPDGRRRAASTADFRELDLERGAGEPAVRSLAVGLGDRDLGWLGDRAEIVAILRGSLAWEQAVALPEDVVGSAWDLTPTPPADVLRWATYVGKPPLQAERDFLRPLWRLVTRLSEPAEGQDPGEEGAILNRWLLARLHETIATVGDALESCEPTQAAGALSSLVGDIRRWYTPPWPAGEEQLVETLSRLLAPFVPHLAEAIYRLGGERAAESAHLLDWPTAQPAPADRALLSGMSQVWRLVALGKIARGQCGLEADRLLCCAHVTFLAGEAAAAAELIPFKPVLAHLLGVARVQFSRETIPTRIWHLSLVPDRPFQRLVPAEAVDAALAALKPKAVARLVLQLWEGRSVSLDVAGQAVTLLPDEVRVSALPGWAAAAERGRLLVLEVG